MPPTRFASPALACSAAAQIKLHPGVYLNPRQLETFYYVVLHGGIGRAIGRMPYAILQPAISEQMRGLETTVGRKLFQRTPFRLTDDGAGLFALVAPFFRELAAFVAALQPGPYQIRIAAEELLLQHYLAPVVPSIISHRPDLQLSFRSGLEADMTHLLREGEVDLIVTTLAAEPPSGISNRLVAELNLALIVNPSAQIDSAEQLWTGGQNIIHPLVCSAPSEGIAQIFHRGLKRGGLQWPTRVIASSLALVPALVASGSGIGVCLDLPHVSARYDVRTLPLCGFDLAKVVALWRPPDTIKLQPFIRTISKAVFGKS